VDEVGGLFLGAFSHPGTGVAKNANRHGRGAPIAGRRSAGWKRIARSAAEAISNSGSGTARHLGRAWCGTTPQRLARRSRRDAEDGVRAATGRFVDAAAGSTR